MNKQHYISVIVPAYNCAGKIEKCIKALLDQDYPKDRVEIIIVDNNSNDGTSEAIKKFPVTYILQDRIQSAYASRNKGIQVSKGDILAFTDSDCIPMKSWLSKGAEGFEDESVGCVAGEIESADPENYVEEYLKERNLLAQKNTMNHSFLPYPQTANAFYRKDVFDKIGYFESKWTTGGDGDLAWRMQLESSYKIKYVPESRVLHKHRSTLKSLFTQRVKWGIGRTNGYKKYRNKMKKRRFKETIWDLQTLFILLGKVIKCYMFPKYKLSEKRKTLMLFLSYSGIKLGHLLGSIKNGVYCV